MKILITGATGFLGLATARRLHAAGHVVTAMGRNSQIGQRLQTEGIKFMRVDLQDREDVVHCCEGQQAVIHCAALASPWGKYQDFYDANVVGTENLLAGCLRHGVRRLVNISTPSIYFDYQHRLGIRESDPLPKQQATHYSSTKLLADERIAEASKLGLEVISIRPRAIFGPGDKTVLGRLIRLAEKGTVPLVNGGTSLVDMTYIDNCVDAIVLCLEAPKSALGKVFNISNGEPISTRSMLDLLGRKLGLDITFRSMPFFLAHSIAATSELVYRGLGLREEPPLTKYAVGLMSKSQTLDINAAKMELGYEPLVSLEAGFERFALWWKSRTPLQASLPSMGKLVVKTAMKN